MQSSVFNLPFLDHKYLQSPNCFVVSISDSFSVAQLRWNIFDNPVIYLWWDFLQEYLTKPLNIIAKKLYLMYCIKSVGIWSISGPCPVRMLQCMDIFHAVICLIES